MPIKCKRKHKNSFSFLENLNFKQNRSVLFYALVATGNLKTYQLSKVVLRLKNTYSLYLHQKCTRSKSKKIPEAYREKQRIVPGEKSKKIKWEFFRADTDALPLKSAGQLPNRKELPSSFFIQSRCNAARIGNHLFRPKIIYLREYIFGLPSQMINYRSLSGSLLS
jgi:hypothetical protein